MFNDSMFIVPGGMSKSAVEALIAAGGGGSDDIETPTITSPTTGATGTDAEVRVIKQSLLAADEIKLDDSEMIAGIGLYVSKGFITESRALEILS